MDRNMQVIFCLKVVLTSWVLDIWVSSTSFQKIDMGWPKQPPAVRVSYISKILEEKYPKGIHTCRKLTVHKHQCFGSYRKLKFKIAILGKATCTAHSISTQTRLARNGQNSRPGKVLLASSPLHTNYYVLISFLGMANTLDPFKDFWWSIPQNGTGIDHLGARDDHTIRISKYFDEMRLSRSLRLLSSLRSLRLQRF